MIWMKLTRTDAVFSRTAMVLFIVQKTKVLGMTRKSTEISFGKYKKYWQKNQHQGAHTLSMRVGAPSPLGAPPYLVGPLTLHRPQLQLHIFRFLEKKSERKFHRVLRYGATAKTYSLLGGLIRSLFGALERGIRRRRHHQPSSITNFMMLTAVHE